ncbi:hypothetical protein MLD38_015809 [Melastoma candidum]|uniref:Uncharacterized protein n=1 Tax=Melastoma candidum TaxID=119954 RepID=A0ACB9RLJ9_9MYRT|nr:hypothetical protein MLD38_015809 [Melastoma candidum]
MKKTGLLAASLAATAIASASPAPSSSSSADSGRRSNPHHCVQEEEGKEHRMESSGEMFAPRFDGLRFIETLVTAHR